MNMVGRIIICCLLCSLNAADQTADSVSKPSLMEQLHEAPRHSTTISTTRVITARSTSSMPTPACRLV